MSFLCIPLALLGSFCAIHPPAGGSSQVHQLVLLEKASDFRGATGRRFRIAGQGVELLPRGEKGEAVFESAPVAAALRFSELLPSWNIETSEGTGVLIDIQLSQGLKGWSPWLFVGEWGQTEHREPPIVSFDRGRIAVDYFRSSQLFDRARYRIRAQGSGRVFLRRFALCFSNRQGEAQPRPAEVPTPAPKSWQRRLPVPYRSQRSAGPDISSECCSPTSVAMVMAYRGVDRPTRLLAQRIRDPLHKIFGNWPRAVQGAFVDGVPGYITRFSNWDQVKRQIAAGQPLIISIAAGVGELRGAPYSSTTGHLIVLCGFDAQGDIEVNDPGAKNAAVGQRVYFREDIEKAWLRRGGTAYVLLPKDR